MTTCAQQTEAAIENVIKLADLLETCSFVEAWVRMLEQYVQEFNIHVKSSQADGGRRRQAVGQLSMWVGGSVDGRGQTDGRQVGWQD